MKRANAAARAGLPARRQCRATVINLWRLLALAVKRVEIVAQRDEEILGLTPAQATREARIARAGDPGDHGADDYPVDATGRCHRQWLARRPDRPQGTAHDFDRVVFHLQFPRRAGAELLPPVSVPGSPRHRHG